MSNAPVYSQLIARLQSTIDSLGIVVHEKKAWVVLEGPTGNRIAIARSAKKLPRVETTLDLPDDLPEVVEKITDNGRMKTALVPRPDVLVAAIEMLADRSIAAPEARRGSLGSSASDLDSLLSAR